jgi:hypothetical protein
LSNVWRIWRVLSKHYIGCLDILCNILGNLLFNYKARGKEKVKKTSLVLALLLLVAGCGETASNQVTGSTVQEGASYDLQEVSEHDSEEDCWMIIDGKVYDITGFIANGKHGTEILKGCGKDATELYQTRPMGSGTPHSDSANAMLEEYYIGDLE